MMTVWKSRAVKIGLGLLVVLVLLVLVVTLPFHPRPNNNAKLGFTFSVYAAKYLGIDPDKTLAKAMADLHPAVVRLPLYWDAIETKPGVYDWSAFDRQLALVKQGGAQAILAVGAKLPRWPECHIPAWLSGTSGDEASKALLAYLEATVNHYAESPDVAYWQVENEALFPFGQCPSWSSDRALLEKEIVSTRLTDGDTPIITTDSGELSFWLRTSTLPVDGIAISLYRAVYNGRVMKWIVNPYFYRLRRDMIAPFVSHFLISELQTEPWGSVPIDQLPENEILASFKPSDLADRVQFAREVGAESILTWGVEWWYYRAQNGDASYLDAAKQVFNPPAPTEQ